ncbi:hypothetical protein BS78_05G007300 [Paspalum vaginatum]|nr:hypothetical protein BS78_05G007300 [Paspalum vaginatum]
MKDLEGIRFTSLADFSSEIAHRPSEAYVALMKGFVDHNKVIIVNMLVHMIE